MQTVLRNIINHTEKGLLVISLEFIFSSLLLHQYIFVSAEQNQASQLGSAVDKVSEVLITQNGPWYSKDLGCLMGFFFLSFFPSFLYLFSLQQDLRELKPPNYSFEPSVSIKTESNCWTFQFLVIPGNTLKKKNKHKRIYNKYKNIFINICRSIHINIIHINSIHNT